tara:strand:+ start:13973 stop:15535 length:1563 start_codon:yes stop_codon:yes gene_type:complete
MAIDAETVQYGPWGQGVRYDLPPEDITANGLQKMQNTRLNAAAAVERRHGTAKYESTAAISGPPTFTSVGEFQIPGGAAKVFATAGTKFYEFDDGWVDRTSTVTITAGDDNTFEWVRAFDKLVLTNGVNGPIKWTGSGNISALDVDSRFTTAKHVGYWDNRVWMGYTNANSDRLWYSDAGDPETWGSTAFYNFGAPITALVPMQNALSVHTEDALYTLIPTGNSQIPYQVQQRTSSDPRNPQRGGTISGRAVIVLPGNVQVFPLDDGIYMWTGGDTIERISYALDEGYWDNVVTSRLSQCFAVYWATEDEVWFWLTYGSGKTKMNDIMVLSTKHLYQDPSTGTTRMAWYGPYRNGTNLERNCAAIIDGKPHAGSYTGVLYDHAPENLYTDDGSKNDSYFMTGAAAPYGADVDLRWLYAKTYFDALGEYTITIDQESQGVGVHSGTFKTVLGGAALDSFTLGTSKLGTTRMVSKDLELRGYDPHSSLLFTNNNSNEPYRVRRTHLQYKVIGRRRKQKAGMI